MGLSKKLRLKPDAIPTLFPRAGAGTSSDSNSARKRESEAGDSTNVHVKRARTAFEKRERARVSEGYTSCGKILTWIQPFQLFKKLSKAKLVLL